MKPESPQISDAHIKILYELSRLPIPGRDMRHSTWKALSKRGLIDGPGKDGFVRITESGKQLLAAQPKI